MAGGGRGLIADIGATNARFALTDSGGIHSERVLPCADYPGLAEAMGAYLADTGETKCPGTAAFAVAGPVTGDHLMMTNHHWEFSISGIRADFGMSRLEVVNDFKAQAMAIPYLKPGHFRALPGGEAVPGAPIGVLGPGTGLGVASLIPAGEDFIAVPGEGGHVTQPAMTQRQFDVISWLKTHRYRHVSAERVCSGKGLVNIYDALCGIEGCGIEGCGIEGCGIEGCGIEGRTPEDVGQAAIGGSCPLCVESLEMMTDFLAVIAGNLALTLGAHGGIYIAGGIVNRFGEHFDAERFRRGFVAKGRYEAYLGAIPTYVVTHPYPAFLGLYAALAGAEAAAQIDYEPSVS